MLKNKKLEDEFHSLCLEIEKLRTKMFPLHTTIMEVLMEESLTSPSIGILDLNMLSPKFIKGIAVVPEMKNEALDPKGQVVRVKTTNVPNLSLK